MKRFLALMWLAGAAGILGCGKSGETPEPTPPTPATPAAAQAPATPAASPAQPGGGSLEAVKATADQAVAATKAAAAKWTDQFLTTLQPSSDSVLKGINPFGQ